MRKKNKGQLKRETGTGTSFHSASCKTTGTPATPSPCATYISTPGPEDDFCSCHRLDAPPSPVLNLHIHEWIKVTHTHSSLDNIFSNLFYNICQVGSYSFSSLSQNNGKPSTVLTSLLILLSSSHACFEKQLYKHNMRFPITIYHQFMWHCSIFGSALLFSIFNNLLALLATAAKAQLSGRVQHRVYHRVNCSIKILSANLPHLNEWNSETLSKTYHIYVFLWLHLHFYQHT